MNILVINCGSSSLKFQVINSESEEVLAKGICERIGIGGVLEEGEILEALDEPTVQKKCTRLEDFIMEHANLNQDNYTAFILQCL